jgi:hypothetical protein
LIVAHKLESYAATALLSRSGIRDKISRKFSAELQACGSLAAYICHSIDGQGKAMMA